MKPNRLYGFYRGTVLKHLNNGKCKIWIPGIYSPDWNDVSMADMLPDAEQASPIAFGTNKGLGIFSYPNIGSIVWCFFANGDQNLPVYFASTLGGPEAIKNWNEVRKCPEDQPNDAYVHTIKVKDSHIDIYETGQIDIKTEHDGNKCAVTLDAYGNITLESTGSIKLKSKQISINASTQVDIMAPNIKSDASIHHLTRSPGLELNASEGHIQMISRMSSQLC